MAKTGTTLGLAQSLGQGLILLLLLLTLACCAALETWQNLPALETFANYEDMQRYYDQRNLRSLRYLDNPTDDSYVTAFNKHNEQLAISAHSRPKREERKLPTEPRLLRFELSDAVEPSAEVKQLVQQHQSRSLKDKPARSTTVQPTTTASSSTTAASKRSRKPRRQRRAAVNRQPANFKVQMIPFEESDAREPDAATAHIIKRARALDLQQSQQRVESPRVVRKAEEEELLTPRLAPKAITRSAPTQRPFKLRVRKTKRVKRAAPPEMLKFELEDAKEPPPALQRSAKQLQPTLLTMETNLQTANQNQTQLPSSTPTMPTKRIDDNLVQGGESTAESKRLYIYKEAPPMHVKSKKSVSALPHEVQKVITQLMKEGHGGKAYVKYVPAQKFDYEHYKAKQLSYNHKPLTYVKYLPPVKAAEAVHVQIQPVPVVEQLRYVYKPSYAQLYSVAPTMAQPIVVQETPAPTEQVHHTYTAELAAPPLPTHTADVITPQFRASKPDPLHAQPEHTISYVRSSYGAAHIKPIEHYKYELHAATVAEPQNSPLIKIEYLAPADSVKERYKELPEFRELSTLIGKSPDDQIHGLTYLLAKEMQAKLQRQGKQLAVAEKERPQDNTAPILFHPGAPQPQLPTPNIKSIAEHGSLGVQGRLIGMAKTKQYVPIIEPGNNDVKELPTVAAPKKLPTPSSFIDFAPGHGLSHGYEGVSDEKPLTTVEHVIHHPTLTHHGLLGTTLPAELEGDKISNGLHYSDNKHNKALQQYASKYAFGYRIRDFHTGNDFGHKQNRDLHGVTRGQYHILLPDGRIQNVIYHADDTGFHADVSFEGGSKH